MRCFYLKIWVLLWLAILLAACSEPQADKNTPVVEAAQIPVTQTPAAAQTASDYTWAVFHQPNTKFPQRVAQMLGFTPEQIAPGLLQSNQARILRQSGNSQ